MNIEQVRETIAQAEVGDTTLSGSQMVGFDAGYAAAADGDLDLCQGTMDRVNLLLDAGDDGVDFAIGNLIGFVQYHQELLRLMVEYNSPAPAFVHDEHGVVQ